MESGPDNRRFGGPGEPEWMLIFRLIGK